LLKGDWNWIFMSHGKSTFKCAEYVKRPRSSRDENTAIRSIRSASTSEHPKKQVVFWKGAHSAQIENELQNQLLPLTLMASGGSSDPRS
jgi:hypothetical protein